MYFHKKRIYTSIAFCTAYGLICNKMRAHPAENVRLGFAGSLAFVGMECAFHIIDTINIRSKVADDMLA